MRFLLDTNAWIVYLKVPQSSIRRKLEQLHPNDVALCSVAKAELFHGAEKYGNREGRLEVLARLFALHVPLPFDDKAAAIYGRIRHELETQGFAIGPNDLMIVSIALANDLVLVTHDVAELGRVSGLSIQDWES